MRILPSENGALPCWFKLGLVWKFIITDITIRPQCLVFILTLLLVSVLLMMAICQMITLQQIKQTVSFCSLLYFEIRVYLDQVRLHYYVKVCVRKVRGKNWCKNWRKNMTSLQSRGSLRPFRVQTKGIFPHKNFLFPFPSAGLWSLAATRHICAQKISLGSGDFSYDF